MDDPSGGLLRWWPQQTWEDVLRLVDPLLNLLLLLVPYLSVAALLGSPMFVMMWLRMEKTKGPRFTDGQERKLRSVPLSVGIWGLITLHFCLIVSPRMTQAIASSSIARDILEIMVMGFAFFTTFGILNLILRFVTEPKIRRKFNLLDLAIIGHVMGALGTGLFAWATVRHASVWTATVAWQHWVESFTFSQGSDPAIYSLPAVAKLHVIMGSLAFAIMCQSRVITLMLIPRPRLWRFDSLIGTKHESLDAGRAVALMYGVSADEKAKH
ncbi:MAG: respiratory nitrate reductase subunit gamma [Planctomycetes bacterium]|nr:respiratory nitrate reductase subunit gamma [Planctomycetota bacterium]